MVRRKSTRPINTLASLAASLLLALMLSYFAFWLPRAYAQDDPAEPAVPVVGPRVHTIVAGETLTSIAGLYDVTIEEVQFVNHLRSDDILAIGQEIIIPGGEVRPALVLYTAELGDTLAGIASGFNVEMDQLLKTNRTLNRDYIPGRGQLVAIDAADGQQKPATFTGIPYVVQEGETLLDVSARFHVPESHLMYINELSYPPRLYPGQRLRIPGEEPYQVLPGEWSKVAIKPQQIKQGDTVSIYIENLLDGEPVGFLGKQVLRFFDHEEGYMALVGLDAFTEPGGQTLLLAGRGDRAWYPFEQQVLVNDAGFPGQSITIPEELGDLLDPTIRTAEDTFLDTIYTQFSDVKQWDGLFQVPVTDTVVTAYYGGSRTYNEVPALIFHTGVDFDGGIGTPILAAADGTVVYNDTLELRGNSVIIDHGLGVMTGYYHLSESFVEVGQEVEAGQSVGAGGSTGLSTGPHLHWDLRIGGIPVDPMPWTKELYP